MLSAHAHSFRQKSRLAISLSWVAGYTNVIILILTGETVSHMTGNSTRLGNSIGSFLLRHPGAGDELLYFGFIIMLFLLGALVSGVMTEGHRRGRSSKYALPIVLEAILLSMLVIILLTHPELSHGNTEHPVALFLLIGISAFAMGLQNATITRISGAVVRTTHLTGVITDLGLELVLLWHWWRDKSALKNAWRFRRMLRVLRRQPSALRVFLLASIFGSFMFGVIAGTVLFEKIGPAALLMPVLFLSLIVLRDFFRRQ
jgi:uncharacterized membrane protein YoaK (UPF0700 family)